MRTKRTTLFLTFFAAGAMCLLRPGQCYAQADSASAVKEVNSPNGGAEKFLLAGEATTLWQSNTTQAYQGMKSVTTNSFGADPLGLMLMPLVKISDRLFLDAQIAVTANQGLGAGGSASAGLNEAIIYYRLAPGAYLFTGFVPIRTGLYEGILDDFTNRFGTDPVGMGIVAAPQPAVGIQGGLQTGTAKINYQLYVANGPRLLVDSTGAANGQLDYGNFTDNNQNKAIGGSIGFLPLSNSNLEIGISGQYTPKTGDAGSNLESINNTAIAAYLNYYHVFNPLMVRLQGQYEESQTQSFALYTDNTDTSVLVPSFNNKTTGWYGGITFRLSGSQNKFLSNLELGARIGQLTLPQDTLCLWTQKPVNQTTICLTYWITWKTPINIAYDIYTQNGSSTQTALIVRGMWFF